MSMIKRRLKRLEKAKEARIALPRYLVVAGPVSVIDRTVTVIVPEKRSPDQPVFAAGFS